MSQRSDVRPDGSVRGPADPDGRLDPRDRTVITVLLVSAEPLASPAADLLRSRAAAFSRKIIASE